MIKIRLITAALLLSCWVAASSQTIAADAQVNIYSARKEVLIKPLLDAFTAETGIVVNLVSAKADALLQRLEREAANSPADVFLTTDAGRLAKAKQRNLLQAISSELLDAAIPAQYRDPDGAWYGLSIRARPIIYAVDRVTPAELSSYLALAGPDWKDRICVRSSSNIYNQSMLAAFIHHRGAELTEDWARGLVANFARKPQGGDTGQIRAVAAGECDVALANTYYLARLTVSAKPADRETAAKVAIFWPDQDGFGVHVNISGAGVTRAAGHVAEAVALLEFLAGPEAQRNYAEVVHEYPMRSDVAWSDVVSAWGRFVADDLNLAVLGDNNAEALRIADRAGWR